MAVKGNRILATGRLEDVQAAAGEDADLVDLKGRTVMPGLIDPHTHILIGALMDQAMDYVGITRFSTTDEILGYIRHLDSERPEDEWIVCRNYYPMLQAFEEPLGFSSLDRISGTRPDHGPECIRPHRLCQSGGVQRRRAFRTMSPTRPAASSCGMRTGT
jgi:predicted amidohydrolase YtcJ